MAQQRFIRVEVIHRYVGKRDAFKFQLPVYKVQWLSHSAETQVLRGTPAGQRQPEEVWKLGRNRGSMVHPVQLHNLRQLREMCSNIRTTDMLGGELLYVLQRGKLGLMCASHKEEDCDG